MTRKPVKFGDEHGAPIPRGALAHRHHGDGWSRWEITTAAGPVSLLRRVVAGWQPPFCILYVLVVGRGREEGRYQSPRIGSFREIEAFLEEFCDFIECDGRHELWIHSFGSEATAVLSRTGILNVYGDDAFGQALQAEGYGSDRPSVPVPHSHLYHPEFDEACEALLSRWPWQRHDLQPDDGE